MNYIKILKKIEEKQNEIMVDRFYGDDFTAKKAAWITKSDNLSELLYNKIEKI